jgi:hypothetical protein
VTGYFSQLAYHTGVDAKVATGPAAERAIAVQRPETVDSTAMHVEEISFTGAPATGTVDTTGETSASSPARDRSAGAEREDPKVVANMHGASATASGANDLSKGALRPASDVAFTDSGPPPRISGELSTIELFPASTAVPALSGERSAVDHQQSLPPESIEIPYGSIEIVDRQSIAPYQHARSREILRHEAKDTGQSGPRSDREPLDTGRDPQTEHETTGDNYLKEVRAWVSGLPELDQREQEWERGADQPPASLRGERSFMTERDAFALQREAPTTAPHSNRSDTLEAQELNLSIGTISIVVEAPNQIAPSAPQAPTRVDSPRERSASEPTRLSRYYLEPW